MKSLRITNTITAIIFLLIIFSIFSYILFNNQKQMLSADIDTFLYATSLSVADSINILLEENKIDVSEFNQRINQYFQRIIKSWISINGIEDPKLLNMLVQIYDRKGLIIATSRQGPKMIMKVSPEEYRVLASGKNYTGTFDIDTSNKKTLSLRYLSIPVMNQNKKIVYIIRVALSLRTMTFSMYNLKIILFILIPFTIILSGLLGFFITGFTLSPVNKIIVTINEITAVNLKKRLNVSEYNDELKILASTFNDMIERLDNSFESQKHLVENLYHELKTPLSIIRGEIEITLNKKRDADTYRNVLLSNIEEIDRITRILENLLLISRFESKLEVTDFGKIDIVKIVSDIAERFKIVCDPRSISLTLNSCPKAIINGDEKQIKSMIVNLIDNAIKYNIDHGNINIIITSENGTVTISIKNTGIGIPEETIDYIFDRYYRAIKSSGTKGAGLGLNIVKTVVDIHKGTITARSVVNNWAEFEIILLEA